MAKGKEHIIGIRIQDRLKEAGHVQEILTRYGCSITTRLGLHEAGDSNCSSAGLILLQLIPDNQEVQPLLKALGEVKGITVKEMEI